MKRIAAFLACLFLLSCLTGCMLYPLDDTTPVLQNVEGALGSYYVKITDHFVTSDLLGKDILVLSYAFTNNRDTAVSASSALQFTVYQGGIELSSVQFLIPPAGYDSSNAGKKLKDDATLNCQAAFSLLSTTTPVEVEVRQSLSFGTEIVTAELDIAGYNQLIL